MHETLGNPTIAPNPPASSSLSEGALIGIGVGFGSLILASIALITLCLFGVRNKRKSSTNQVLSPKVHDYSAPSYDQTCCYTKPPLTGGVTSPAELYNQPRPLQNQLYEM
jgi:hypothetical protein